MNKFLTGVQRFLRDEEGTEVVEWALVAGLVVAVGATVFATMGGHVADLLGKVNGLLLGAKTTPTGG